jgi:hypothetical protein
MLLIIENAKTTELIDVGMAITNATMDWEKLDKYKLASAKKELDHMLHLEK